MQHSEPIDLRSDTVTRPTPAMREAMMAAPVGDDVWGDDPSIQALETRVADIAGKESALMLPSGTQSNLAALMAHCQRGDEYIVGQGYHTYRYEAGGAAVLGGIQPQPVPVQADGSLSLDDVRAVIKPDNIHFARTRVLSLENTQGGKVLSESYLASARALANEFDLILHLDGARLFNAAVALDVPLDRLTQYADSVSLCFSKGLGAPVGSVLTGSADTIERARRWRKMLGGGMRQAGILAAAMDYALDHHVARLADDHRRARVLADGLEGLPFVKGVSSATNMVFAQLAPGTGKRLEAHLSEHGILVDGLDTMRLVTHLDIDDGAIAQTVDAIRSFKA